MRLALCMTSVTLALVSSGCGGSSHRENSMTMEVNRDGERKVRHNGTYSTYARLTEATGNNADGLTVATQNNTEELARRVQANSTSTRDTWSTTTVVSAPQQGPSGFQPGIPASEFRGLAATDAFQQQWGKVAPPAQPVVQFTPSNGGVMPQHEQRATNASLDNVYATNAAIRDTAGTQLYVDQARQTSQLGDIDVSNARWQSGIGRAYDVMGVAGAGSATLRGVVGDWRSIANGGAPNYWESVVPSNVGPGQFLQGRRDFFRDPRSRPNRLIGEIRIRR